MKLRIALGLLFYFLINPSFTYSHESSSGAVIHMSEKGYEPDTVNIEVGQKVIFENVGDSEHWPASDSHPSHTLFDGTTLNEHCKTNEMNTPFDSCKGIKSGESWEMTFSKSGDFIFHDHLWPHLKGSVIVTDSNSTTVSENSFWEKFKAFFNYFFKLVKGEKTEVLVENKYEDSKLDVYKPKYLEILDKASAKDAINTLSMDSESDEVLYSFCHEILHTIGKNSFSKYGSFEDAIIYNSDFCNSGYIHGVFEEYFRVTQNPELEIKDKCIKFSEGKRPFDAWQCVHGVGHGLMYLTGGDLDQSLEICNQSFDDNQALDCTNGVYMEVFNSEFLSNEKNFIDPQNPQNTCDLRTKTKSDCYVYLPTYFYQVEKLNFSEIFKKCEDFSREDRSNCVIGIGTESIKRNMDNPEEVFNLCLSLGGLDDQYSCIFGVANMYMNQKGSYLEGRKICEYLPIKFKQFCQDTVNQQRTFFAE